MPGIRHSVIELFSVELWREIFDYFNSNELWYTFHGLNKKIDGIIVQTPLLLNFEKKNNCGYFLKNISNREKKSNYRYCMENILPAMNIINLRSLKLRDQNETNDFFSVYSLNALVQLRLLSLDNMYSFNDNSFLFWNQLLSLKYLRTLKIHFANNTRPNNFIQEKEFIIRSIFNNEFCPLLESFIISTCDMRSSGSSIPWLITPIKTTNIKYLSIDSLTYNDLMKLLPALRNVKSFRMDNNLFHENTSDEQQQRLKITLPLLSKCIQLHLKVSESVTFEHIEYLLKHTPNLKDLFLWGWNHLFNAKKWEMLLSMQCPKLLKFELICARPYYHNKVYRVTSDFRQQWTKASFWLERNVTIIDTKDFPDYDSRSDIAVRFNIEKVSFLQILTDFYY